ncbi:MAG: TetR family transcriptional regulator [Microbacterium sp.]|uniref:TetR/AcrR family transcriptional regulator n=1 Tax=Microbacterium sp. TaxID=51671 RepID=UPI0039E4610F
MPRLTDARRRSRRDQIADAAIRCFARQGFAQTSMADIIDESGLSAGSIYSHFASKAELVRFASAEMLDSRLQELAELFAAQAPLTPGRLVAVTLDTFPPDREQAQLLLQIWADLPRDPELASIARTNIGKVRDLMRTALRPWARDQAAVTDASATTIEAEVAEAVMAAVQGYVVRLAFDPDPDPAAVRRGLARAFG